MSPERSTPARSTSRGLQYETNVAADRARDRAPALVSCHRIDIGEDARADVDLCVVSALPAQEVGVRPEGVTLHALERPPRSADADRGTKQHSVACSGLDDRSV